MPRHAALWTAVVFTVSVFGRGANGQAICPTSQWRAGFNDPTYHDEAGPVFARTFTTVNAGNPVEIARIAFDEQHATVDLVARAGYTNYFDSSYPPGDVGVRLIDDFELVGPVTGGPFPIHARLTATGFTQGALNCGPFQPPEVPCNQCYVSVANAVLTAGSETRTRTWAGDPAFRCTGMTIRDSLEVPILATPGTPFRLLLEVGARGAEFREGQLHTLLQFPDLPPGYAIRSCNGYSTGVTPALRRTWGSIKSRYH